MTMGGQGVGGGGVVLVVLEQSICVRVDHMNV